MKRNNNKFFVLLPILAVSLLFIYIAIYTINNIVHQNKTTEPKITKGPDNNINVHATRSQIRNEIAAIVVDKFLAETKIDSTKDGLRLTEFKNDSPLAKYGFKEGDIIREINGQKIGTAEEVIKICDTLEDKLLGGKSAEEIKVVLNRDGEDVNINFRIPEFIPEKVHYNLRLEKRD